MSIAACASQEIGYIYIYTLCIAKRICVRNHMCNCTCSEYVYIGCPISFHTDGF